MSIGALLVSVVIPAFNASATIDETLRSVRSQSHRELEIIVVDDGSTDNTITVVRRNLAEDPRISIIEQHNAGVAAARNAGWQVARADFVAFIDADDLWTHDKIEQQLRALLDGGKRTGLVYSWYDWIDADSCVSARSDPVFHAGQVLDYLCQGNFIGNGSSALVRREALIVARGFESGLRASGAEGCEDLLFYCRVAEAYHFAVVPEYQIGYRYLPNNMSSNMPRMFRSWMLVADEIMTRHPGRGPLLEQGFRSYARWLLRRALTSGQLWYFASIVGLLCRRNPLLALRVCVHDVPRDVVSEIRWKWRHQHRRSVRHPLSSFAIGDPNQSP
ncbi:MULTISPECIES: glycosyltransferase family 2 protein [unclassified Bradyrhizobium]|uniref:glycosyltransferase family 2 protein n=1 Tax=unclassified Bradyrhizobium TaxID=2631580 RepID=UPI001FFBCE93|nr:MULTISPECIES: glycosyltransferase family 2 protein [unclassified Bradyrhizobium]MCK1708606.1 glycosyltransferase family 2 protein [Bradyrhizobium sp. 143]MCK1724012.1 glycosyltransferase family 2 protein [Bradyrhizobium sp. 142]